jgi:hypothetical protein
VADRLRQEPGLDVQLIDGHRGELSVTVDGHMVAQKTDDKMPSVDEVVNAVRAEPAHA